MTTSNTGKDLIKEAEGLHLKAYVCPAGKITIGWGHTKGVYKGQRILLQQAEDLFTQDIRPIEQLLNGLGINFRQEQFDALVSCIFNIGPGSFEQSTMLKLIKAGAADEEITDQIVRWVYSKGVVLPGLVKRRVKEANLFLGRERYKITNGEITKT